MKQFLCILVITLWLSIAGSHVRAQDGAPEGNYYTWNLGSAADMDATKVPNLFPSDRFGVTGSEGEIKYRLLKPDVFQAGICVPAFDFDPNNYGAINSVFFLRVHFKDVAKAPVFVHAGKGGCGFYGAGYVGSFGGAGDSQWKDETIVIPRSMMRTQDGKTFRFAINNIKTDIPVASLTLFSANTTKQDAKASIAAALKAEAARREAMRQKLLPGFKDLGLPDPGAAPAFTAAETQRGYRVFFPPIHRQLFANSQPKEGELSDSIALEAAPGETLTLTAAVRAIKDVGEVSVKWADAKAIPVAVRPTRWARYSEQRIGSSWGKDYRVCPEQLAEQDAQACMPNRLEIATITFGVAKDAKPGEYTGQLEVSSQNGGKGTFPIKLRVYPFVLQHPDHSTHGQFYYINYGDVSPFEAQDMRDHGMDMVVSELGPMLNPDEKGDRKVAQSRAAYKMLKELGYRSPLITSSGNLGSLLKDPKNHDRYTQFVQEEMGIAKAEGFDVGFFAVDEPHTQVLIDLTKKHFTWTRDVAGAKTYVTANPTAVPQLGNLLDYVCYNLSYITEQQAEAVRKAGQTLMFYCPSIDVNPEVNRYRPGFYQYKLRAYSTQYFAYMEGAGDWFVDLDGDNRDWNVVYPSMTSPMHDPTLEWEAMRQGVDDWMYCYTLESLADTARKGGKMAAADTAMKVLADVLASVDVDGAKAGGPAMAIEANVSLKDKKLDPKEMEAAKSALNSAWYEQSRRKIAAAIIELQKAVGQ